MTNAMNPRYFLLQATCAALLATATTGVADEPRLETYQAEDGQAYFALTMPAVPASADGPRDVVVLFDTSASQAGFYRDTAIAALRALPRVARPQRPRATGGSRPWRAANERIARCAR